MLPWSFTEEAAVQKYMPQLQHNIGVVATRPVRPLAMSTSNAGAEFRTREVHLEHEKAKAELKRLVPQDARQASGHGVRAKRSKSGSISLDLLKAEDADAAIQ